MDFGKLLSEKKVRIAVAVAAIAFLLLWIQPFGYATLASTFPFAPGAGFGGFQALTLVTTFAMLFYGLGYVQKEKGRESIKFLDGRNVIALAFVVIYSVIDALFYSQYSAVLLAVQFAFFGALMVLLDHYSLKKGIASGINLFLVASFALNFLISVYFLALGAAGTLAAGSTAANSALASAIIGFAPAVLTVIVFLLVYRVFKSMKAQRKAVLKLFHGSGKRIPIPYLFPALFSSIIAGLLIGVVFTVILIANGGNNSIWASYTPQSFGPPSMNGGIVYLLADSIFPLAYPAPYGVGSYAAYFNYLGTASSRLQLSSTNIVQVPEWLHAVLGSLLLISVSVLVAWAWVKLISKRLKLEHTIPRREWLFGSAALAFLASLGPILSLSGGIILAAGVVYFLRGGIREQR